MGDCRNSWGYMSGDLARLTRIEQMIGQTLIYKINVRYMIYKYRIYQRSPFIYHGQINPIGLFEILFLIIAGLTRR